MKIPALLMASLLMVGVAAQTTKPVTKTKKPVKKVKKIAKSDTVEKPRIPKIPIRKDTIKHDPGYCPACGLG